MLCDPGCLTCVTRATNCLSCYEEFFLLYATVIGSDNTCVFPCPVNNYYSDEVLNVCGLCNPGCPLD